MLAKNSYPEHNISSNDDDVEGYLDVSKTKPASRPIAKAIPFRGKFAAQFALPGLRPELAREKGQVIPFDDEEKAVHGALMGLFGLLHFRSTNQPAISRLIRMTTTEFVTALEAAGISWEEFALLYGVSESRVRRWLTTLEYIPQGARTLVLLLANRENLKIARELALAARMEMDHELERNEK